MPISVSTIPKLANQDAVSSHTEIGKVAGFFPSPSPFFQPQIFFKATINGFAQWLSLNLFHLNYLAFIYTILEHFISEYNIYHGFFSQRIV